MSESRYEKFRDAYRSQWRISNKKEIFVKELVEKHTGRKVEFCGLGAGSTERFRGSAGDNGFDVGAPDLHVTETPFYLEVTGPNTLTSRSDGAIWVRPDKIRHAYKAYKDGYITYLIHILPKSAVRKKLDALNADFMADRSGIPLSEKARIKLGKAIMCFKNSKLDSELLQIGRGLNNKGELFDEDRPKSFDNDIVVAIPFDETFFKKSEFFKIVQYSKKGILEEFVSIPRDSSCVKTLTNLYDTISSYKGGSNVRKEDAEG